MAQNILFYDDSIHKFIKSNLTEADVQNLWQQQPNDPTSNDIPPNVGSLWLNTNTGELFVCYNIDENGSYWKGQLGTIVVPATLSTVDIFGDGSCIALYRFDNSLNDDSGLYNGTLYEGSETYAPGVHGQCFYFDGSSDINIGDVPVGTSFAVSFWLKTSNTSQNRLFDGTTTNEPGILTSGSSAYGSIPANTIAVFNYSSSNYFCASFTPDGQWHFFVINIDVNSPAIWIDNVAQTITDNMTSIGGYGLARIGSSYNGAYKTVGYLDQVRIFNRTLTTTEADILYNES